MGNERIRGIFNPQNTRSPDIEAANFLFKMKRDSSYRILISLAVLGAPSCALKEVGGRSREVNGAQVKVAMKEPGTSGTVMIIATDTAGETKHRRGAYRWRVEAQGRRGEHEWMELHGMTAWADGKDGGWSEVGGSVGRADFADEGERGWESQIEFEGWLGAPSGKEGPGWDGVRVDVTVKGGGGIVRKTLDFGRNSSGSAVDRLETSSGSGALPRVPHHAVSGA